MYTVHMQTVVQANDPKAQLYMYNPWPKLLFNKYLKADLPDQMYQLKCIVTSNCGCHGQRPQGLT